MHHLSTLAIVFFVVGSALHTLAQVDAIARAKNNPLNSRLVIFEAQWVTILIRATWSLAIFALWLQGQLADVLHAMKVTLPDTATGVLDLHVSWPIAFLAGYAFDSGLGFIPGLKSAIPAPIDAPAK